jgi:hypothetical protein
MKERMNHFVMAHQPADPAVEVRTYGPFATEQEAEAKYDELEQQGFSCVLYEKEPSDDA